MQKKHQKIIELGIYDIFKTKVLKGTEINQYGMDGLVTVIDEALVRQQIIQLAELCRETSAKVALKAIGNKVVIEFW